MTLDPEVLSSADVHNPLREFPITNPTLVSAPTLTRLLWDRKSAASQLSVSVRALDYLIATGKEATRRIGSRVLIPA